MELTFKIVLFLIFVWFTLVNKLISGKTLTCLLKKSIPRKLPEVIGKIADSILLSPYIRHNENATSLTPQYCLSGIQFSTLKVLDSLIPKEKKIGQVNIPTNTENTVVYILWVCSPFLFYSF